MACPKSVPGGGGSIKITHVTEALRALFHFRFRLFRGGQQRRVGLLAFVAHVDQVLLGDPQRTVVVVQFGHHLLAVGVAGQVVDVAQLVELLVDKARDHVALRPFETEVVLDVFDQRLGILPQEGVALCGGFLVAHGRSGVIGLQEGVGVGVGEAHLRGWHPLQPQVEQLDGLCDAVLPQQLLGHAGEGVAGVRGRKVVLDEVVGVDPRVFEVAVAERVAQQRRGVVGVDASDLVGVLRRGEDRHQAVGVAVELKTFQPWWKMSLVKRERK